MEKSYVSLEQKMCPICTKTHDVGILLDKGLKNSMEQKTLTGWGFCPPCDELHKKGYVALVEIDPTKSVISESKTSLEGVYRTGRIFHLKRESELCSHLVKEKKSPFIFIDIDLGDKLGKMQQNIE